MLKAVYNFFRRIRHRDAPAEKAPTKEQLVHDEVTRAILGATMDEIITRELVEDAWRVHQLRCGMQPGKLSHWAYRILLREAMEDVITDCLLRFGAFPCGWVQVAHSHWNDLIWFNPEIASQGRGDAIALVRWRGR